MRFRTGTIHLAIAILLIAPTLAGAQNTQLTNPLAAKTIADLVEGLLRSIVYIALPLISLAVVYSGFKFVVAQGNESKLGDAKKNFYYVILGAILILGAWAIAQLIGNTVNQLR